MEKRLPPIEVMPDVTTPVIDIQDLEHNPGEDTRVDNAGVPVLAEIELAKQKRKQREAIERSEGSVKELPQG